MNAPIAVTVASSRDLTIWANTRRHAHPRVFAIDVAPAETLTFDAVCHAVLVGLGKNPALTITAASPTAAASAWLSLHEHTDAFVVEAQLLPIRFLDELIDMLCDHAVTPWLLLDGEQEAHLEAVTGRGGIVVTEDEFRARFPGDPDTAAPGDAVRSPGRLPRVSGFVFRAACRDLLDPRDAADVDARFVTAVTEIRSAIGDLAGANKSKQVTQLVRHRVLDSADADDLFLQVCAAQVAALPLGFLIDVDISTLIGAAEVLPRRGRAGVEKWWELIDAYIDPRIGATAALFNAEIDPGRMASINRADVSAPDNDGSVLVTVDGESHVVSWPSSRFVLAQCAYRDHATAGDAHRLLSTHRPGAAQLRHVTGHIAAPAADLGVRLAKPPVREKRIDPVKEMSRYGISVRKLAYTPKSSKVAA